MKSLFLSILAISIFITGFAQTLPVTFHYDARQSQIQTVVLTDGDSLKDDDGDRFFEITLDLEPGQFDYGFWIDHAGGYDPANSEKRNGYDGSTMRISDPMVTYLLPKNGDMMRENRIRADLAYTPENPPIDGSLQLTINGKSVANAQDYFNSETRILQVDNPPYLVEGENVVAISYETNMGSISRSSTFIFHSVKLMVDERVFRMENIFGWGRVLSQPYPDLVYVKCNENIYEAAVNEDGYFGAAIQVQTGTNTISTAFSQDGFDDPVDVITREAELRHDWWVELTGSVNDNIATILATEHDVTRSELTYAWKEGENNPASLGISGNSDQVSFTIPEAEGEYTIELHIMANDGTSYIARKIWLQEDNPHFLALNERAPWMKNMLYYDIEADYFGYNNFTYQKLKQLLPQLQKTGVDVFNIPPINEGGFVSYNHFKLWEPNGTKEEFIDFVKTAHDYGIKVIMDVSIELTCSYHPFLRSTFLARNPSSPYYNLHAWEGTPGESEPQFVFYPVDRNCVSMNLEDPYTIEYMIKDYEMCLEVYGVDGIRFDCQNLDALRSLDYTKYLYKRLKNIKPDCFTLFEGDMVGDTKPDSIDYSILGDAYYDCYFASEWGGLNDVFKGIINIDQFHEQLTLRNNSNAALLYRYANTDYHDFFHNRFDFEKEDLALSIVFTQYGMPGLFHGEELGAMETNGPIDSSDPLNRMPLYQRLISMRKQLLGNFPEINRLSLSNQNEIYAYTSLNDTTMTLTVCNFTDALKNADISFTDAAFKGKEIKFWAEITDLEETEFGDATATTVNLDAWESKVFMLNIHNSDIFPALESIEIVSLDGGFDITENGKDLNLTVETTPEWSIDQVEWLIESDEKLAMVDMGRIRPCGCGSGEFTLIARSKENPAIESRKTVTVSNQSSGELYNANFNDNVTEWSLENSECNVIAKWDDGKALLVFDDDNGCYPRFQNDAYLSFENGKNYLIGFDARSSVPRNLECLIQERDGGHISSNGSYNFYVSEKESRFYSVFNIDGETSNNIVFFFLTTGDMDSLWIDNVSICETDLDYVSCNVSFQVDMQGKEVSTDGVYIKGNWNDWNEAVQLQNTSGSIYSISLEFESESKIDYKFYNGNPAGDWGTYEGEDFEGTCTDEWANRIIEIAYTDTILDVVCFNSCEACEPVPEFSISVLAEPESSGIVSGAGTYEEGETINLSATPNEGFEFVNWTNNSIEQSSNSNFSITVTEDATYIANFQEVSSPDFVEITFRVDMQNETVSSSGVFLRGSFNEWSSNEELQNNGAVYYKTIVLESGTEVEYKFVNGDQWETENQGDCSVGDNHNRQLIVPENNTILDLVCFNSCNACNSTSLEEMDDTEIRVFPNPTQSSFKLTNLPIDESVLIKIYDSNSVLIREISANNQSSVQIELVDVNSGIFLINISGEDLYKTIKIIKED